LAHIVFGFGLKKVGYNLTNGHDSNSNCLYKWRFPDASFASGTGIDVGANRDLALKMIRDFVDHPEIVFEKCTVLRVF
jgi:hypothetical protein